MYNNKQYFKHTAGVPCMLRLALHNFCLLPEIRTAWPKTYN